MSSANKSVALRFLYEYGNEMKPEILYEIAHPEFHLYDNQHPPRNLDEQVNIAKEAYKVWKSLDYTVEDIIEENDKVVIRWTWKGKMLGDSAPEYELIGTWFFEMVEGLIKTIWCAWDESIFKGDS